MQSHRFQYSLKAMFAALFFVAVAIVSPILLLPLGSVVGYVTQLGYGPKRRMIGAGVGFVVAGFILCVAMMVWVAVHGVEIHPT